MNASLTQSPVLHLPNPPPRHGLGGIHHCPSRERGARSPRACGCCTCTAAATNLESCRLLLGSEAVIYRALTAPGTGHRPLPCSLWHVNPALTICINFCYMCYLSLRGTSVKGWTLSSVHTHTHTHPRGKYGIGGGRDSRSQNTCQALHASPLHLQAGWP